MTSPLDEKGTALPDGMEVVAWRVKDFADGWMLSNIEAAALSYQSDGHLVEPLVLRSQAHSTIAAMRAKIERLTNEREAWMVRAQALVEQTNEAGRMQETAEAEVKRLTEDNEALRAAIQGLNVTDKELVRIHNSCTGVDGEVKIWSKMLHMLVANIIAVRAALNSRKKAE